MTEKHEVESNSQAERSGWFVFGLAIVGAVLLWLSFAPVAVWPLAWIALVPWFWLAELKELPGKRPLRTIWFATLLYWLASLYYLPIPHPMLWAGWVVLSLYLSMFSILFFSLARNARHQLKLPAILVYPLVWTGIEFIRSNYGVEFSAFLLGHTQFRFPLLIQTADLFGAYSVSFFMSMFATAIMGVWMERKFNRRAVTSFVAAIAVFGSVVGYGFWKTGTDAEIKDSPGMKIVLIQGSIDTRFPATPEEYSEYLDSWRTEYRELTWQARSEMPDLDLIIWPEGSFVGSYPIDDPEETKLEMEVQQRIAGARYYFRQAWAEAMGVGFDEQGQQGPFNIGPRIVVGCGAQNPVSGEVFNSAALLSPQGELESLYNKEDLIIFGEYVPFARQFPFLAKMSPIGAGLDRGSGAVPFKVNGMTLLPNICFESLNPALLREHVLATQATGQRVDALLNMTNDGWFYGTACLDHHLACNVFRSVEMRKPMLVAANTGFSAVVDSRGSMRARGPRRDKAILYWTFRPERDQFSLYFQIGDWIGQLMALFCAVVFVIGVGKSRLFGNGRNTEEVADA